MNTEQKDLNITRADVNFIYSCIPTLNGVNLSFNTVFGHATESEYQKLSIEDDEGFSLFEKEAQLNSVLGKKTNEKLRKYDKLKFKRHRPFCRKGISQYLTLDLDMGFVRPDFKLTKCQIKLNEHHIVGERARKYFDEYKKHLEPDRLDLDIEIKPIIRIFPNGVSCTIKVSSKATSLPFGHRQVHKMLHLIGTNKNCSANYLISVDPKEYNGEFNIFDGENELGQLYNKVGERYEFTIFNFYRLVVKKCILEPFQAKFDKESDEVELLCSKYIIKTSFHESSNHLNHGEPQSPWVVTNIEVNDQTYSDFNSDYPEEKNQNVLGFAKSRKLGAYQKALTPLIYRGLDLNSDDFSFDSTYYHYSQWESDYLNVYSIHFDNRIFVQMSRRSILTITQENGIEDSYPGRYFIPGLLDISELIRVRWQTLLLLNYLSDQNIRKIKLGNFKPVDNSDNGQSDYDNIESIMNQIYQLATCLDSPSSYVISGDALREIQERLIDTFRLNELTQVVLKKANILENLRELSNMKRTIANRLDFWAK